LPHRIGTEGTMFSSYNHRYFTTNVLSRENNEDLAHWPNTPFNFDIPPGMRLLDDEPLVSPSLSPEGNDLASGRQVYQQPPLTQPQQVNQMPAASGLTPFLSPSSPPSTSNFSAIYPSPTSSQRSIPTHSSEMGEELLQRQLSNSQP
ncbi:3631_t:CDS:1, partial [Acaulospora morrowiae]